jgi:hypothetical protein
MLSKLRNWYFTSKKRLLPVISYLIRYIEVRVDLTIHFPTYFGVVISLQHFPCITYSAFLRYHASWSSVHGTKMYVTVQYVYIVTRGSELMFIGVIHLIFSRSRHTTLAFYSFESICR